MYSYSTTLHWTGAGGSGTRDNRPQYYTSRPTNTSVLYVIKAFIPQIQASDTDMYYSTTERWTGKYWIDGKKIYMITISVPLSNLTNEGNGNYVKYESVSSYNIETPIRCECCLIGSGGGNTYDTFPFTESVGGSTWRSRSANCTRNYLQIRFYESTDAGLANIKASTAKATIYYTKTT